MSFFFLNSLLSSALFSYFKSEKAVSLDTLTLKSGTSSKSVEFDRQTLILKTLKATVLLEKNKGNDIVGVQTSIIDIICQHKRSALSQLQPKILHRRFDARVFCSASFFSVLPPASS